ncbi:MAG TPA: hypothetical protein VNQ73_20875 [Ilumatobacter sp.]|nr:hypothetical protein [Ilumatobacter sp.]
MRTKQIPPHDDNVDDEFVALAELVGSEQYEPGASVVDAAPLRRVVAAHEASSRAAADLTSAARDAHAAGLSWTAIGAVLGISRQAARQRFAERTTV